MPIRFRCAYCNQLMGIARRKVGTVVRCPKCAGQVVVPNPDVDDAGPDVPVPEDGPDDEPRLDVAPVAPRLGPTKKQPAPRQMAASDSDEYDVVALPAVPKAAAEGVVVSRLLFTFMILAMLALVCFAYYMGYITGKKI